MAKKTVERELTPEVVSQFHEERLRALEHGLSVLLFEKLGKVAKIKIDTAEINEELGEAAARLSFTMAHYPADVPQGTDHEGEMR